MLLLFVRPHAPPCNVQAHRRGSTSILVQWSNVPAANQNGVILSYTVTYKVLSDGSPQTKVVNAPTTQVTLTGLNEYTNYSITVFSSTVREMETLVYLSLLSQMKTVGYLVFLFS